MHVCMCLKPHKPLLAHVQQTVGKLISLSRLPQDKTVEGKYAWLVNTDSDHGLVFIKDALPMQSLSISWDPSVLCGL